MRVASTRIGPRQSGPEHLFQQRERNQCRVTEQLLRHAELSEMVCQMAGIHSRSRANSSNPSVGVLVFCVSDEGDFGQHSHLAALSRQRHARQNRPKLGMGRNTQRHKSPSNQRTVQKQFLSPCGDTLSGVSDSRIFFKEGSNLVQETPPVFTGKFRYRHTTRHTKQSRCPQGLSRRPLSSMRQR